MMFDCDALLALKMHNSPLCQAQVLEQIVQSTQKEDHLQCTISGLGVGGAHPHQLSPYVHIYTHTHISMNDIRHHTYIYTHMYVSIYKHRHGTSEGCQIVCSSVDRIYGEGARTVLWQPSNRVKFGETFKVKVRVLCSHNVLVSMRLPVRPA